MKTIDQTKTRGTIRFTVYKNGVAVEYFEDHNLVVNGGKHRLAELISGKSTYFVTQIGFGTGTLEAKVTDTTLDDLQRIDITSAVVDGNSVTFHWYLDEAHCNGMNITELALFASDGTMITHYQRGRIIGKEIDTTIRGEYILNFV